MFLVLFKHTLLSMFGLATSGANPANVSLRPKHVRVLIVTIVYHCIFTDSEKNVPFKFYRCFFYFN